MRVGARRLALGAVVVNAPQNRFSRPAMLSAEPEGTSSRRRRKADVLRIDPSTGRIIVVVRGFQNPFGIARLLDATSS